MARKVTARWFGGTEGDYLNVRAILLGLGRGLFLSMIGLICLILAVVISQAEVFHFSSLISLILVTSVLLGGLKTGTMSGKNGWLHGICVALSYTVIVLSLGFLVIPMGYNIAGLLMQVGALALIGAFGGIVGVNLKDYQVRQQARTDRIKEKYWSYHKNQR